MLKNLKVKSEFKKNILILMTGTAVAQAIPIAISPILTRIYTPQDFGVYALFVAILYILGSIINARYDLAIMLPKKDEDAINIFALGFIITCAISIFTLMIVIVFNDYLVKLLGSKEIGIWLYFIPIALFFTGLFNILNYFNTRRKNYKDLRNAIMLKSIILAIIQLSVGFTKQGASGLISGQIISNCFANMKLLKNILNDKLLLSKISKVKIISLAKRYKKFPKYSSIGILADNISRNLITILIASFYGIAVAGFYSISKRILDMPTALIGESIKQVFFEQAIKEKHKTRKSIIIFIATIKKLIIIGLIFFGILYFVVEDLFAFVFGETWRVAGVYAKIMIPLFFVKFIIETIIPIDSIMEKQKNYLIFNIILLFTSIFSIYIIDGDFESFLYYYTYILSFIYIVYGYMLYKMADDEI